jgi:hypothetical protein
MEHAVGDGGVKELVELVVAVEGAGGCAIKLGEEGEAWSRDGIFKEGFVVRRRGWDRDGRLLGLWGFILGIRGWRGCFLGWRGVGGRDCLGRGARAEGCGDEGDEN